jgi:hypothetical protein
MQFEYHWLHIPSGKTGTEKIEYPSEMLFVKDLLRWNRSGGKLWKYWSKYEHFTQFGL